MAEGCEEFFEDELDIGADVCVISAETKSVLNCNYLPLKMILDDRTREYVRFSKTFVIFQGQYTRYRSETINQLPQIYDSRVRIIGDDNFLKERIPYSHAPDRRREFANYLHDECTRAFEKGNNLIVLDATILDLASVRRCLSYAYALKYTILVVPPVITQTEVAYWPLGSMAFALDEISIFPVREFFKPLFCGYFFNEVDSADLREACTGSLREMVLEVPEFYDAYDHEDFFQVYHLNVRREEPTYAVFKIFSNGSEITEYFKKDAVKKNYGKVSKIHIFGFIVTPYVVVARVRPTKYQKELWGISEDIHGHSATPPYPTTLMKQSKAYVPESTIRAIRPHIRGTFVESGDSISTPTQNISMFTPAKGCHILLGTVNRAPVRHIDFDGNFAAYAEALTMMVNPDVDVKDLCSCYVRQIDKYFYIYLKNEMTVKGMFTACSKPSPRSSM